MDFSSTFTNRMAEHCRAIVITYLPLLCQFSYRYACYSNAFRGLGSLYFFTSQCSALSSPSSSHIGIPSHVLQIFAVVLFVTEDSDAMLFTGGVGGGAATAAFICKLLKSPVPHTYKCWKHQCFHLWFVINIKHVQKQNVHCISSFMLWSSVNNALTPVSFKCKHMIRARTHTCMHACTRTHAQTHTKKNMLVGVFLSGLLIWCFFKCINHVSFTVS